MLNPVFSSAVLLGLVLLPLSAVLADSDPRPTKAQMFASSVQLQKEFCAQPQRYVDNKVEGKIRLAAANFAGTPFQMYVHSAGDIVSSFILRNRVWEGGEVRCLTAALEGYVKRKGIRDRSSLTFLDIGAQIGWYTLGIGLKGYRVIAFEPMKANWYMARKSLCMNPKVNAVLLDKALGTQEARCDLYTSPDNTGDPNLFCPGTKPGPHLNHIGSVDVCKLDDFAGMMGNLVAIKLDIEGFEHNVMRAGKKVMLDMHAPFILTEFSIGMTKEKGGDPRMYLKEFEQAGYSFSVQDFGKATISIDQAMELSQRSGNINLFLMHKSAQ